MTIERKPKAIHPYNIAKENGVNPVPWYPGILLNTLYLSV